MKDAVFNTCGIAAVLMALLSCASAAEARSGHDHSLCQQGHGTLDSQNPMALQYPRSRQDEWAGWTTHPTAAGTRATPVKSANATLVDQFTMTIVADGGSHPATFRRRSVRSPGFAVLLQGASGGFTAHAPGEVATYLGTLDNNPDALAAAVVLPDNTIFHQVVFSDGEHWINVGGDTNVRKPGTLEFLFPGFVPPPGATASGLLKRVDVGVDMPQHIYSEVHASNTERALRLVEYSLLSADLLYIRQVGIQHHLGRLVIRTSQAQDPYAPLRNQSAPNCVVGTHCLFLNVVQEQWSSVLPAGPEHMAMVLREVGGAGLANVGQIGTPRGYSSNDMSAAGDFSIVWRHEAGHNWSLGHYDGGTQDAGPEGGTSNSNNVLAKFSGPEVALIARLRDSRDSVLPVIGPMLLPVPPHAATDSYLVRVSATSTDLPVLDNDHDVNGESLQLLSVNRVSGTLAGQASVVGNQVRYTPTTQATNGFDVFEYTIANVGTRGTARGFLFVSQVDFGTRYQQDFNAFANGTTALGDGSTITQLAGGATSASVQGGALELTPDALNRFGAFTVPMIGVERGFTARFRYNVSSAGTAADAFAFNFGQRVPAAGGPRYHGFSRGATIEFNTLERPGFRLFINGVEQSTAFVADNTISNGQSHQAEVVWDGSRLSLRVDGQLKFDRLGVGGFVPSSQDGLAFSARTIGLSQRVLIDDVIIESVSAPTGALDQPALAGFSLPAPNPPNANCPAGFFIASVLDGPGAGLSPGTFGMELLLDEPGTRVLAGGLNFGGLVDRGQVGFAAFNFANANNERQRLNLSLTGSPASDSNAGLPVRVVIERRSATGSEIVFDRQRTITLAAAFEASVELPPAFYVATVEVQQGDLGGAPEGQFFFAVTTSFLDRPGGGFQGGAVVGGYHASHPFGGVSGFAAFCLATPHSTSVRVLSQPTYGPSGARDLRLRVLDAQQRQLVVVPGE